MSQVYNQPSDFNATPVTVPASNLMTVTDSAGNVVAQDIYSRPEPRVDSNNYYSAQFANTSVYSYPLTVSFSADPNAVPVAPITTI